MDCEQAKAMVTPYIEGTLTDKECIDFLKHVKKCPNRGKLTQFGHTFTDVESFSASVFRLFSCFSVLC